MVGDLLRLYVVIEKVTVVVALVSVSVAVTVKVDVVFETTAVAVPEKVPLEFKVNPAGIEPVVTETVGVLSSSENEIGVKFDDALFASTNVPKEPEAVENTGVSLIDNVSASVEVKPETFVSLIS